MIVFALIVALALTALTNLMLWRHFCQYKDGVGTHESQVSALRVLVSMIPMCLSNSWLGTLLVIRVETAQGFMIPLMHLLVLVGSLFVSILLGKRGYRTR